MMRAEIKDFDRAHFKSLCLCARGEITGVFIMFIYNVHVGFQSLEIIES